MGSSSRCSRMSNLLDEAEDKVGEEENRATGRVELF